MSTLEPNSDPTNTRARCFSVQALERCTIHASVHSCGKDLVVNITGGSLHHVGACALGTPDSHNPQDPAHATVSVLCAPGHRDDEVARLFAKKLASELSCNVCVSAGIHIDDATPDELKSIVEACKRLLNLIINNLQKNS